MDPHLVLVLCVVVPTISLLTPYSTLAMFSPLDASCSQVGPGESWEVLDKLNTGGGQFAFTKPLTGSSSRTLRCVGVNLPNEVGLVFYGAWFSWTKQTESGGSHADEKVQLMVGGSENGNNKASGATWSSSTTTIDYGAQGDMDFWGVGEPSGGTSIGFALGVAANTGVVKEARTYYAQMVVYTAIKTTISSADPSSFLADYSGVLTITGDGFHSSFAATIQCHFTGGEGVDEYVSATIVVANTVVTCPPPTVLGSRDLSYFVAVRLAATPQTTNLLPLNITPPCHDDGCFVPSCVPPTTCTCMSGWVGGSPSGELGCNFQPVWGANSPPPTATEGAEYLYSFEIRDDDDTNHTWDVEGGPNLTSTPPEVHAFVFRFTPLNKKMLSENYTVSVTVSDDLEYGTVPLTHGFSLAVVYINDPPVVVGFNAQTVDEGTNIELSVVVTDDDAVGVVATLIIEGLPFAYTEGPTTATKVDNVLTITGTPADVGDVINSITFLRHEDYYGFVLANLTVTDNGETGVGGVRTWGPAVIALVWTAVNDAPLVSFGATMHFLSEDVPLSIPILTTLSDVESTVFDVQLISNTSDLWFEPANLTGVVSGDGTYRGTGDAIVNCLRSVAVRTTEHWHGVAAATVLVADNGFPGVAAVGSTFTFVVAPVNDPPAISLTLPATVNEDQGTAVASGMQWDLGGAVDLSDVESPLLNVEVTSSEGCLIYTGVVCSAILVLNIATADFNDHSLVLNVPDHYYGRVNITVVASDNGVFPPPARLSSISFEFVILPVQDEPMFLGPLPTADGTTNILWEYISNVFNPDPEDTLEFTLLQNPPGMTVSPTGIVRWIPPPAITTSGPVILQVNDGTFSKLLEWTTTVDAVNDQPNITGIESRHVTVGVPFSTNVLAYDSDDTLSGLTFLRLGGPAGLVVDVDGGVSWPDPPVSPEYVELIVSVQDGGENKTVPNITSFTLRVNSPPVGIEAPSSVPENTMGVGSFVAIDSNSVETFSWHVEEPPAGTLGCPVDPVRLPNNVWTAAFDFERHSACTVRLTVVDSQGLSFTASIVIGIDDVPEAPVAQAQEHSVSSLVSVRRFLNGTDEDGTWLVGASVAIVGQHEALRLTLPSGTALDGGVVDGDAGMWPLDIGLTRQGLYQANLTFCLTDATGLQGCANVSTNVDVPCEVPQRERLDSAGLCAFCPRGNYAGLYSCFPCPEGQYWEATPPNLPCRACPVGGSCAGGGDPPRNTDGWWPQPNVPNQFVQCSPAKACLANLACNEGHQGDRCAECQSGWYKTEDGGCKKCPPAALIVFLITLVAMTGLCCLLVTLARRSTAYFAPLSIGFNFLQTVAIMRLFDLNWSDELKSFFNLIALVNIDVQLFQPACALNVGANAYFTTYILKLLFPVYFFFLFSVGYGCLALYHKFGPFKIGSRQLGVLDARQLLLAARAIGNAFLTSVVFMYLALLSVTFEVFSCTKINDNVTPTHTRVKGKRERER